MEDFFRVMIVLAGCTVVYLGMFRAWANNHWHRRRATAVFTGLAYFVLMLLFLEQIALSGALLSNLTRVMSMLLACGLIGSSSGVESVRIALQLPKAGSVVDILPIGGHSLPVVRGVTANEARLVRYEGSFWVASIAGWDGDKAVVEEVTFMLSQYLPRQQSKKPDEVDSGS